MKTHRVSLSTPAAVVRRSPPSTARSCDTTPGHDATWLDLFATPTLNVLAFAYHHGRSGDLDHTHAAGGALRRGRGPSQGPRPPTQRRLGMN